MPYRDIARQVLSDSGEPISFGPVAKNKTAVITGAASGIGLAAAQTFAKIGMKLALVDTNFELLLKVKEDLKRVSGVEDANIIIKKVDVSQVDELVAFREDVLDQFGEINVLMNNAAISAGGGTFANNLSNWRNLLEINLFGVINGVQTFAPFMATQENPSVIINTGSKQGITAPPGNSAYNVSKAAVKSLTEALAHELREQQSNCTAHLFVPGWTFTGMTSGGKSDQEKPAGAWTAIQTVEFMLERLERGDFYIICPDNETTEEMDRLRMAWSATDVVANRPALSRWHPEYKSKFDEYMREGLSPTSKGGRSRSRGRNGFLTPVGEMDRDFGGASIEIRDGGRRTPAE